ncbi:MAG: FAD-linked oxidase C-terminal domain-containing protein [Pseudomonadota bacterium]
MGIPHAIETLSAVLGDKITTSKSDRDNHGRSESHFSPMPPDAVAYPHSTQDVVEILQICHSEHCPVIGFGTGTSLEAQTSAPRGGISVDFSHMASVIEVRPDDRVARVQPGLTRTALNTDLRDTGLFFPVDPGADASIGGMASTRASGTTTVRYGTMRDNVLGLTVVLADGTVIKTGTMAAKSSAGYDLTALFVGAEGTLGLITELTLKLHSQPEATAAAICAFSDMGAAVECVQATIQCGIPMARIEFVDAATAAAFNAYAQTDMPHQPHLMVEFHGSPAAVKTQAQDFGELVTDFGGSDFQWSTKSEDRNRLWAMRHNAYYAILASRKGARAVVTDLCVPLSKLAQAVEDTRADIADSPIPGPILGHVGDGNFHAILMVDPENAAEKDAALDLSHRMVERALALGGTVTGEHGVGLGKLGYMEAEHGAAWATMATLKRSFDPKNILNPGKLVRIN